MRSSNPSSRASGRVGAVGLILILGTLCFGQAGRRPPQSEQVKKPEPTASETTRLDQKQQDQAIKLGATLVTVPVVASDHDGRYIPDMRREDFSLHEDGVRQEIVFFATGMRVSGRVWARILPPK